MMNKNKLFLKDKPKLLIVYLLPFALAVWGIGNIFYWEIYKGYSACEICAWHRGVYITLFILLLILFKYRHLLIKCLVWIALIIETLLSLIQIFKNCSPLICRFISLTDKLNLTFVIMTITLTFIFELRVYLKHKKQLRRLLVKHDNYFKHFKLSNKLYDRT